MAILNLDNIVLQRTVMGIECPACAGALNVIAVKFGWISKLFGKKEKISTKYRCEVCKKKYEMVEVN